MRKEENNWEKVLWKEKNSSKKLFQGKKLTYLILLHLKIPQKNMSIAHTQNLRAHLNQTLILKFVLIIMLIWTETTSGRFSTDIAIKKKMLRILKPEWTKKDLTCKSNNSNGLKTEFQSFLKKLIKRCKIPAKILEIRLPLKVI